jgi:hypothetical protein
MSGDYSDGEEHFVPQYYDIAEQRRHKGVLIRRRDLMLLIYDLVLESMLDERCRGIPYTSNAP